MSPGEMVRGARIRAGLRQAELARRAGTSRTTLSAYEQGRKVPSAGTLARLPGAAGAELTAVPRVAWLEYPLGRGWTGWVADQLWRLPVDQALARVRLPLELNWSGPRQEFDLGDRRQRGRVYEVVLREGSPEQLRRYVDGTLLVDLWETLVLPQAVRAAWQPVVDHARPGVVASSTAAVAP